MKKKKILQRRQPPGFDLRYFMKTHSWWVMLLMANLIVFLFLVIGLNTGEKSKRVINMAVDEESFIPRKVEKKEEVSKTEVVTSVAEQQSQSLTLDATTDQDTALQDATTDALEIPLPLLEEGTENAYIIEERANLWSIATSDNSDFSQWKTIIIKNHKKIDFTVNSLFAQGDWKVFINPLNKLILKQIKQEKSGIFSSQRKKSYALQLLSFEEDKLETALQIVKKLIQGGYYAYLYKTESRIPVEGKDDQYFLRVRVGFFESEEEVLKAGKEIEEKYRNENIFTPNYWLAIPEYEEISGQLMDFVVQRYKPWFIELETRNSKKEVVDDLKHLLDQVDYAYVSQKSTSRQEFLYRIRIGFFEKGKEAEQLMERLKNLYPDLIKKPRLRMIRTLQLPRPEEPEEKESEEVPN